jgi:carbon-monoxide dehydrogenase medium subunit
MTTFDYHGARTREEAVELLVRYAGDVKPLAGGTDLINEYLHEIKLPDHIVGITEIDDLAFIDEENGDLRIGATTTMRALDRSAVVRQHCAMLAESAGLVGSRQIRNLATVGGNICNAVPSADTAPPLVAAEASALIQGPGGLRKVPLAEFFVHVRATVLNDGELLTEFAIPKPPPRTGSVYRRHTPRKALDLAMVGVAVSVTMGPDDTIQQARIALGAVAPVIYRVAEAEALLAGNAPSEQLFEEAGQLAADSTRPISDVRGSADYRREITRVLTRRCLAEAVARAHESTQ